MNTEAKPPASVKGEGPFAGYDLDSRFYDEMFDSGGRPRESCGRLNTALSGLAREDLEKLQEGVYRRFLYEGITFTVLDADEATERIIPIDCVPRLLSAAEWDHVERGLKQRLAALNLFLKDVYHEGRCLREGVVPVDVVLGCPQYRMEMRGIKVPHDVYVAVRGTDIVRTHEGFAVLEDNLRVPSGVSYMLVCRNAIKDVLPRLYREHRVREVADYAEHLYSTLVSLGHSSREPNVAFSRRASITPHIMSTPFSQARWASTSSRVRICSCATRRCTRARRRGFAASTCSTAAWTMIFSTR